MMRSVYNIKIKVVLSDENVESGYNKISDDKTSRMLNVTHLLRKVSVSQTGELLI